jgi:hypothetical protein
LITFSIGDCTVMALFRRLAREKKRLAPVKGPSAPPN